MPKKRTVKKEKSRPSDGDKGYLWGKAGRAAAQPRGYQMWDEQGRKFKAPKKK